MLVNVITRYPAPLPAVLDQSCLENDSGFGLPVVAFAKRYLQAATVQNAQSFGNCTVGLAPQVLLQARIENSNIFGGLEVQNLGAGLRHLLQDTIFNANQFGAAQLRYSRRYLTSSKATNTTHFGASRIGFATKLLSPAVVANANQFGAPSVGAAVKHFSYANPLGSGDRTASITVTTSGGTTFDSSTHLINGNLTDNNFWGFGAISFKFDLGSPKIVRQVRWRQDTSTTHSGLFQWQGSNDDASYTNIGSTFNLGGAPVTHHDSLLGNNTAYRYYQLVPTSGASISGTPYLREVEFYIEGASDDPPD